MKTQLKNLLNRIPWHAGSEADPETFIVIDQACEVFGEGFHPLKP